MIRRREWLAVILVWLCAMTIAFRGPLLSGFDLGFGDRADGIIEISLLEHWRNVLHGVSAWNAPIYFWPHTGTLGYNDGYFLFGLVYSFWRTWFDPFVSDTLNAATFKTIGFVASWWLARRTLGWSGQVALLIAAIFTVANGMTLQAVHAQLQSVALVPCAMILAVAAWRSELAGYATRARWTVVALAALIGAWLITAYYLAWFTLRFACLLALSAAMVSGNWRIGRLRTLLAPHVGTLGIGAIAFVLAIIPFLIAYAPTAAETGGHGFKISYLVTPIDPINVGPDNLLWGWLLQGIDDVVGPLLGADPRVVNRLLLGEHETGFPLILFALFVAAVVQLFRERRAGDAPRPTYVFMLAVVAGWLLALRIWVVSPWILVHFAVPGASAVRVVVRYQLFLILPVLLLVAAVFGARLTALFKQRPWLAIALCALMIAEQVNLAPVAELSRRVQVADLMAIPAPPRGCAAFYPVVTRQHEVLATNPSSPIFRRPENEKVYLHNVDAMLLAQLWRVPTVGGYATFTPPDWVFADPRAPDYDARVAGYARTHRLSGLCRLDVRDAQPWRRVS